MRIPTKADLGLFACYAWDLYSRDLPGTETRMLFLAWMFFEADDSQLARAAQMLGVEPGDSDE